jgi:zinc protease
MPSPSHAVPSLALLLALAGAAAGQSVERVVLPSGLTVIIGELHTTPAVEVRVAVRAGPLHEGALLGSGVSLLTQRLLAGGGHGSLSAAAVREAIARLGNHFQAETTVAGASFAITTASANLDGALKLLAGMVTTPVIAQEDLDRERHALALLPAVPPETAALFALIYRQHPARLPLAGLPALRDRLTPEIVRGYRAERYRAAATTVLVVGNVNTNEARRLVEQAFADYPPGGFAAANAPAEPPPFAPRYQTVSAPPEAGAETRVILAWRTEAPEHANQAALTVLRALLGGDQGVVAAALGTASPKPLATRIAVDNASFPDQPGIFSLAFSPTADNRAEAEQACYQRLQALDDQGPAADAVDAARRQAQCELALGQSGVHGLADSLLTWEYATGDPAYGRRFAEEVRKVSSADVWRVLHRYLLSREGERGRCTVVRRPGRDDVLPENSALPHPAALVAPQVVPLGRGARLLLHPAPGAGLAAVHLVLGGGASGEDALLQGATALLAETMPRATESRTPAEIAALLRAHGMRLTATSGIHDLDLGLTCLPDDVPLALALLVDCLTKAALPPEEIERARARNLLALQVVEADWEAHLLAETRRIALEGHYAARNPRGGKELIARLDRSLLVAHLRHLAVGANTVLAVYGRFDPVAVIEQAQALIAAHPEFTESEVVRPQGTPWPDRPPPPLTVGTHDRPQAALALAWHGPALEDRARDEAPMAVLGALLDERLARALAATGVPDRVATRSESYDRRGLWLAYGLVGEPRREALQQAVRDEIARCIAQLWLPENDRGALPEAELASAKATCVTAWTLAQEDQDRTAERHATDLLLGGRPELDVTLAERLLAVGRKDLLRVAQLWLAGDPVTVVFRPAETEPAGRTGGDGAGAPATGEPPPPAKP